MSKEQLVIVQPDEESIFHQLDDDVFWGVVSQEELRPLHEAAGEITEDDDALHRAVGRALRISLQCGSLASVKCYNRQQGNS